MDILTALPLAFVMIAGPQIISSFFFATSSDWKRISAAFVFGALISVTIVVTVGYLLGKGIGTREEDDGGLTGVDYAVLALLVAAAIYTFHTRTNEEPPKWMGKLQGATPKRALVLGWLMLGLFPTDVFTSLSVGARLGDRDDPWLDALPFVALVVLFLASPALSVALLGERAERWMPKIRDWMNANSWIVSEIVLVFFVVIILTG